MHSMHRERFGLRVRSCSHIFVMSASPRIVDDLSPWQCRRFSQISSPQPGTCEALDAPPDPYVRVRLERIGRQLRSLPELAELMRNKRLLLLGDSVTGQIEDSMRCLSMRGHTTDNGKLHGRQSHPPLAVRRFRTVALPTLERACPYLLSSSLACALTCGIEQSGERRAYKHNPAVEDKGGARQDRDRHDSRQAREARGVRCDSARLGVTVNVTVRIAVRITVRVGVRVGFGFGVGVRVGVGMSITSP